MSQLPSGYTFHYVEPDGNCLYAAILAGVHPSHQAPPPSQVAELPPASHQLLVKIRELILEIDDKKLQETLWNELLTLTGHSQEAINNIIPTAIFSILLRLALLQLQRYRISVKPALLFL